MSLQMLCAFKNEIAFLLLSYKSSSDIMDINLLADISELQIFSQLCEQTFYNADNFWGGAKVTLLKSNLFFLFLAMLLVSLVVGKPSLE